MPLLTQAARHHLLQRIFWNRTGAALVDRLIAFEQKFDVVVRNYSLISGTNGERWLLSLLDDNPVVFDVGFHDGSSTQAVLEARPNAVITAFDPARFALESYQAKFSADRRVNFESLALSSVPGELEFHDYDNACSSLACRTEELSAAPAKTYAVEVTTVDEYCENLGITRVNFLKIDAEGYDLHVLEGAERLLKNEGVEILIFEFASGWAASKRYLWEVEQFFRPLPYALFRLFNGFLCPLKYEQRIDSCCTRFGMYVAVSDSRHAIGDIPVRHYRF